MLSVICFFFFKQKTAYEMRISDWSSDVCSSDLSNTVFFGDSLTDSGYFRPVLIQVVGPSGALIGKFTTNPGLVWSEYLAQYYGADASPNGNGQSGDNYAAGGARVGVCTVDGSGPLPSLATQMHNNLAAHGGRAHPTP